MIPLRRSYTDRNADRLKSCRLFHEKSPKTGPFRPKILTESTQASKIQQIVGKSLHFCSDNPGRFPLHSPLDFTVLPLKGPLNQIHIRDFSLGQDDFHNIIAPRDLSSDVLLGFRIHFFSQQSQPLRCSACDKLLFLGIHRPQGTPIITPGPCLDLHKDE